MRRYRRFLARGMPSHAETQCFLAAEKAERDTVLIRQHSLRCGHFSCVPGAEHHFRAMVSAIILYRARLCRSHSSSASKVSFPRRKIKSISGINGKRLEFLLPRVISFSFLTRSVLVFSVLDISICRRIWFRHSPAENLYTNVACLSRDWTVFVVPSPLSFSIFLRRFV